LKLPVVYGREVIKALSKAGFYVATVHAKKPVKRTLLRKIIKDAGLTVEEFCRLL